MNFWWATQTRNYEAAVSEGSLWTVRRVDGRYPIDRARIDQLSPQDVVFHYGKRVDGSNRIGAVSQVLESATHMQRTETYSTPDPLQRNDGRYVPVKVINGNVDISFQRAFELIGYAPGGPFDRDERPGQRYLSSLTQLQGNMLLEESNTPIPDGVFAGMNARGGETVRQAIVNQRLEQTYLRQHLLEKRGAVCEICSRELPANLLVTAHIKRRSSLTDDERWQFDRIAMLACSLGCDALFEHRHIIVDGTGVVRAGTRPASEDARAAVASLVGRRCTAWNRRTRQHFAMHAEIDRS
ncbi:hypothetical protein [Plantibacter sp. YIM 135249]|uniref:hypothetical protein n=1 Tax=Plantibacter sp. YIM 135249 TaxID=3423918 RepID=UPI003D35291B